MKNSRFWGALSAALMALLCANLAYAQSVQVPAVRDTAGRAIPATAVINVDSSGAYAPLTGSSQTFPTGASSQQVQGAGVGGATAVGNPVGVGGIVGSASGLTAGQRFDLRGAAGTGELYTQLSVAGIPIQGRATMTDGAAGNLASLLVSSYNTVYNPTTTNWQMMRGDTVGTYTIPTPTTAATNALAATVTSAAAGTLVAKASAGNLYDWQVTTGGTAGYVLIFNATSAPADGTVTPAQCVAVAANSTVGASMTAMPERFSTGISLVFSSTGCFTKTASATAFIRARAL